MLSRTLLGLIAILFVFFSCSDNQIVNSNDTGSGEDGASISIYFSKPASLNSLVVTAQAMVSAPDMDTIVVDLAVTDSSVSGTIPEVPAGQNRKFEIFVYDSLQTLTYYGSAFADVPAGGVITVQIILYPQTGTGTVIVVGRFANGSALLFDGVDDFVDFGDQSDLEPGVHDFTLEAWFNTSATGRQQIILRKGLDNRTAGEGRWVLKVFSTNVLKVVVDDINNYPGSTLEAEGHTVVTDGQWHHVAAVFDRDEALRVYLDGQLEIFDSRLIYHSASIENNTEVHVFMGRDNNGVQFFEGLIDEVRVWQQTRSQAEIAEYMNHHLSGNEPSLLAYWRMDEANGQIVHDWTNHNDGQLGLSPAVDDADPLWQFTFFPYGN